MPSPEAKLEVSLLGELALIEGGRSLPLPASRKTARFSARRSCRRPATTNSLVQRFPAPQRRSRERRPLPHRFFRNRRPRAPPHVKCPTLVLHARDDQRVPVALGIDLAARIPGATLVTLDTDNHIPLSRQPATARIAEYTEAFLRGR
jgi:pimeloyl-ACP methyl ester carboxylesterase